MERKRELEKKRMSERETVRKGTSQMAGEMSPKQSNEEYIIVMASKYDLFQLILFQNLFYVFAYTTAGAVFGCN